VRLDFADGRKYHRHAGCPEVDQVAEERMRRREEAIPGSLSLERRFRFVARAVILVTYDAEHRELVALERPR